MQSLSTAEENSPPRSSSKEIQFSPIGYKYDESYINLFHLFANFICQNVLIKIFLIYARIVLSVLL